MSFLILQHLARATNPDHLTPFIQNTILQIMHTFFTTTNLVQILRQPHHVPRIHDIAPFLYSAVFIALKHNIIFLIDIANKIDAIRFEIQEIKIFVKTFMQERKCF